MSSGLVKFLKSLVKELGAAAVAALVQKHADENRLGIQQRRDLVDELEQVGISVEHIVVDDQAKRALADEAAEPKHDADQAKADEDRKPEGETVAVVDSQGVVQKVVEVQDNPVEGALPISTVSNQ